MTRVHFYQLGGGPEASRQAVARLIASALPRRPDVLVRLPGEAGALALAGEIRALCPEPLHLGAEVQGEHTISLSWGDDPGHHHGLLVNLAPGTPRWFSRFEQLAELIFDQPALIEDRRSAFRFYRERGYPLHFHDLSQAPDPPLWP